MTLPMRCPSSLDSVLTLAADGSASPLTAIEAVCWGEGAPGQCADTPVADSVIHSGSRLSDKKVAQYFAHMKDGAAIKSAEIDPHTDAHGV